MPSGIGFRFASRFEGELQPSFWIAVSADLGMVHILTKLVKHGLRCLESKMGTLNVGLQVGNLGGSGDREDIITSGVYPGQRHLRSCHPGLRSSGFQGGQQSCIDFHVVGRQVRADALEASSCGLVADLAPILGLFDQGRGESTAKWRICDDADPHLSACWNKFLLQISNEHRPLLLDCGNGLDGMCEANLLWRGLRKADVFDFALSHQGLHGLHEALQSSLIWGDSVQVVQIDAIDAQPLSARFDCLSDRLLGALALLGTQRPVLRSNHNILFSTLSKPLSDQCLIVENFFPDLALVDLSSVKEAHPQFVCLVQHLKPHLQCNRLPIKRSQAHAAKTLHCDLEALGPQRTHW
mmetsp:Transcript_2682/g.3540  ORF Transcript_2682/g.3540 Transcript_2682/m.3540 type:complete len:353 (+) Transcript_2682:564-1622(+)